VLVNEGTASAAEFVAGALQGLQRAKLVGARTYGRGQAQVYEPLSDDYGIVIPSALIRTVDGRLFKGTGLKPDVGVAAPSVASPQIDVSTDKQLQHAVEILLKGK
jgi:carboxyl-terminal processing protease